jgi:hypothetical protein
MPSERFGNTSSSPKDGERRLSKKRRAKRRERPTPEYKRVLGDYATHTCALYGATIRMSLRPIGLVSPKRLVQVTPGATSPVTISAMRSASPGELFWFPSC